VCGRQGLFGGGVCVSGGAEEERYPRRPAQQPSSRHSAHLFFSRNISYPALADAGFLFSFFSNICEKMLLYGTPPPPLSLESNT
jgi:hypothetical protein